MLRRPAILGGIALLGAGILLILLWVLRTGATLSGRVLDSEGKPLEKAEVTAWAMCAPLKLLDAAYTDQTGRFELRGLKPGRCSLTVHKTGYAAGLPYTDVPFEGLVITLPTAATIVGKIEPGTGSEKLPICKIMSDAVDQLD